MRLNNLMLRELVVIIMAINKVELVDFLLWSYA